MVETEAKRQPKFVEKLTRLNLTPKVFKNLKTLDDLSAKGQPELLDIQMIGYFQFFRKAMVKLFLDSEVYKHIGDYLGETWDNPKVKKSVTNLNKKFNFEKALEEFEKLVESSSYGEAQRFLDLIPDFSEIFLGLTFVT